MSWLCSYTVYTVWGLSQHYTIYYIKDHKSINQLKYAQILYLIQEEISERRCDRSCMNWTLVKCGVVTVYLLYGLTTLYTSFIDADFVISMPWGVFYQLITNPMLRKMGTLV